MAAVFVLLAAQRSANIMHMDDRLDCGGRTYTCNNLQCFAPHTAVGFALVCESLDIAGCDIHRYRDVMEFTFNKDVSRVEAILLFLTRFQQCSKISTSGIDK